LVLFRFLTKSVILVGTFWLFLKKLKSLFWLVLFRFLTKSVILVGTFSLFHQNTSFFTFSGAAKA
jgi:hypothetical protein